MNIAGCNYDVKTIMKNIKIGTGFTIFILFFGMAAIEAFQSFNWLKAIFWFVIGLVFLLADNLKKEQK